MPTEILSPTLIYKYEEHPESNLQLTIEKGSDKALQPKSVC